MEVKCKTNDTLELSQLVEFQGNLKERTDGDFEKIAKSIKKHGFAFPFFVWKHDGINHVLDGHGRMGALKRMVAQGEHLPPLPVVYVNAKDEADAKELLLKLNSHYGQMSAESVRDFLGDLQINFEDLALPEGVLDLDVHIDEIITKNDNEVPKVQDEIFSITGEIYQLGNNFLLCGDSLNENDVKKLLSENHCSLTFTDPPYELETKGGGLLKTSNSMDQIFGNEVNHFEVEKLKLYSETNIYFHNKPLIKKYIELAEKNKRAYDLAFYKKNNTIPNYKGHLMTDCEYIAIIGNQNPNKGLSKELYSKCYIGQKDNDNDLSYSKPVELCEKYLRLYAKDKVLDLFGGSGSTLIACAKLKLQCFMIEKNPVFADVIRKRWTKWAKENGQEVGSGGLE